MSTSWRRWYGKKTLVQSSHRLNHFLVVHSLKGPERTINMTPAGTMRLLRLKLRICFSRRSKLSNSCSLTQDIFLHSGLSHVCSQAESDLVSIWLKRKQSHQASICYPLFHHSSSNIASKEDLLYNFQLNTIFEPCVDTLTESVNSEGNCNAMNLHISLMLQKRHYNTVLKISDKLYTFLSFL